MENRECKVCCRIFANGKALGGHMRSHKMIMNSSSSSEDDKSGTSSHQDRESETDSSKKHPRRFFLEEEKVSFLDPESFSLSSTLPNEEDAAHCLIMLSRDKRKRDEIKYQIREKEERFEDYDHYSKDKDRAKLYRCEICNKLFRSFQALGGHRASHNKIKDSSGGPKSAAASLERTVACPFCPRVFTSVQAFGGHKRTHFIAAATAKSRNGECFDIDLNLPAEFDEEMEN
ncbi:zinc finger protein ZAT9-like [Henckelia pumila]|uniref:zinc finger protein ZAT9-like n=1 Tax=Henckelia pumila TaxID=405737 RepID=UPI003C6DCFC5